MNKFILLLALFSFGVITAQTEKGTFAISGQTGLGFTSTTVKYDSAGQPSDGPKTSSFNISPSLGYFIINNLEIGIVLDYRTTTTKQQTTYFDPSGTGNNIITIPYATADLKSTQKTLAIIPTATYYFSKGKVRPYANVGLGFANIKEKNSASNNTFLYSTSSNNSGFVWSTGAGLAYLVSKYVGFDLGLGYAQYSYKEDDIKTKSNALGINIGISVFLK